MLKEKENLKSRNIICLINKFDNYIYSILEKVNLVKERRVSLLYRGMFAFDVMKYYGHKTEVYKK